MKMKEDESFCSFYFPSHCNIFCWNIANHENYQTVSWYFGCNILGMIESLFIFKLLMVLMLIFKWIISLILTRLALKFSFHLPEMDFSWDSIRMAKGRLWKLVEYFTKGLPPPPFLRGKKLLAENDLQVVKRIL